MQRTFTIIFLRPFQHKLALIGALCGALLLLACDDNKSSPASSTRYTVTFDSDGGSVVAPVTAARGETIAKPDNPVREGYTFGGWYTDAERSASFSFDTPVTTNLALYARWVDASGDVVYTLTFDLNSGSGAINPQTVAEGGLANEPSVQPTRSGYAFGGWYTDAAGSVSFSFTTPITTSLTVYAKWLSSEAKLTAFYFDQSHNAFTALSAADRIVTGIVDDTAHTVMALPSAYLYSWDATALKASFSVSAGAVVHIAGVEQQSDVTANNLSNPVTYEVTAEDGISKQAYTVTVKPQSTLADIPDDVFRSYLQGEIPTAFVGEQLDVTSSDAVDYNSTVIFTGEDIASLKGIEFLLSIETIICRNVDHLEGVDLSKNKALSLVTFLNTPIKSLKIGENTSFSSLGCPACPLTELDLTQAPNLATLTLGNIQLESLDLSKNLLLDGLTIGSSPALRSLDMTGMRSVSTLSITLGNTSLVGLKVHENVQNEDGVKDLKTARGAALEIATYSAADDSTSYTKVCADYDPNANNGTGQCN